MSWLMRNPVVCLEGTVNFLVIIIVGVDFTASISSVIVVVFVHWPGWRRAPLTRRLAKTTSCRGACFFSDRI